jgi:DNA-binding MarR family transcriptional regulator
MRDEGQKMDFEQMKLENQLCFPLYAASRIITRKYKPLLDPLGLTYTQYIVMLALWEKDSLSVNQLGEILWLDSGTLTPLLKKLEGQGLVRRSRSVQDERMLIVEVTDAGWQLLEKAAEVPLKMAGCLDISVDEGRLLHGLLHKIMESEKECAGSWTK